METLYSKIGPESLKKLVDTFYDIVFDESSISHLFTNDRSTIRDKQYRFLTQFLGGPQLYNSEYGHPRMRMRHAPHAIDEAARIEWLRCMKLAISKMDFEAELGEALYNCFPQVAAHMQNR
ncbi:MAG: globin [Crocinitomicaceae bacterium]|nr:globin [Flavobacteriales bacterium]NQZ37268.1 globin [Crocinitomicaceae bacterium]PHR34139.1 MAG: globin [Fluviicola sp.]